MRGDADNVLTSNGPLGIPVGRELQRFRRRLRRWFRRHRRELPWRRTHDPYGIWLSEVMLQQTRVAAVLPYYRRFLRQFPSVQALARASEEQVLRAWAGLGYYGRARNLHQAAKEIVARHAGRFPREWEAALGLPGIGRYTAAAVLSIAYGAPRAVLDGNVARVLARLAAQRGDLRAPRRWKQLEQTAQQLLAPAAPGDWNQGMMELGARVCTPRAPRCGECPVSRWCRAYALGVADQLPTARRKHAPVQVKIAAAVLLDPRGRTLLVRQDGGLFSRMWQFPAIQAKRNPEAELAQHLRAGVRADCSGFGSRRAGPPESSNRDNTPLQSLEPVRHRVTFREITLLPFVARVARLPKVAGARQVLLAEADALPISSATRKLARAALQGR